MIRKPTSLSQQVKRKVMNPIPKEKKEYDGNTEKMISTGSTLLDLAISGGRVKGGGIPAGILVEIFGAAGSGKTVLLCEIAGEIQRQNGEVMFHDPEARLNKQFARMFGLNTETMSYTNPDTIPEVFSKVREWKPKGKGINGVFADSLAALSTEMEMEKEEGDKMGGRRAKEFSEQLRKTCRVLTQNNFLMVCSNQIRQNMDAGSFGQKYISPGGEAIGFYSSLRLRTSKPEKIKKKISVSGKETTRVIGVNIEIEVFKNSCWKPYRIAPLTILFDYGIDDIRQNLQFIKDYTKNTVYTVLGKELSNSLETAIEMVEEDGLESKLKFETIELWEEIEKRFDSNRKLKR
jgi:protein RecA